MLPATLASPRAQPGKGKQRQAKVEMNRRASVTLHDIVRMNPVAKEHYQEIRRNSKFIANSMQNSNSEITPQVATFVHPEEENVKIEYDPLLLAESLVLLEEQEEENEEVDNQKAILPVATPLPVRKDSIRNQIKSAPMGTDSDSMRRKSAIDEHERVVHALLKMGVQIL